MIIKPLFKNNIALNAHPMGCKSNVKQQLSEISDNKILGLDKPLNVLIIGGSSGYGLASRLVLAKQNKAFTYNISYEAGPSKRLSGSAGFYNNFYFNEYAHDNKLDCINLNADCFSIETKEQVIKYFKDNNKKIDLIIYSIASPTRLDPITNIKYTSVLKPINKQFTGTIIDIEKNKLQTVTIDSATNEEIDNTIKVMGGEDYYLWIEMLDQADVLNNDVKAIAYTYLGSSLTYDIYKQGTIGMAKDDLKAKVDSSNQLLNKYQGQAYLVAAKSIISKASNHIPSVPLYVSALNMLMKQQGNYETIAQHIERLYNKMIYGNEIVYDNDNIVRLDQDELNKDLQAQIKNLISDINQDNYYDKVAFNSFKQEFYNINGFAFNDVDYDEDLDMSIYL